MTFFFSCRDMNEHDDDEKEKKFYITTQISMIISRRLAIYSVEHDIVFAQKLHQFHAIVDAFVRFDSRRRCWRKVVLAARLPPQLPVFRVIRC